MIHRVTGETDPHGAPEAVTHSKITGVSLAWKVTIPTVAALALFMGILCEVAGRSAREALDRQLDAAGAQVVNTLALPAVESWSSTAGTIPGLATRLTELSSDYDEYLAVKYGISIDPPDRKGRKENTRPELSQRFIHQQERVLAEFEEVKAAQRARFEPLLELTAVSGPALRSRIVDAMILDTAGACIMRASSAGEMFSTTGESRRFFIERDGEMVGTEVEIVDGEIGRRAVRSFSIPIRDSGGSVTHRAYAFLTTGDIDLEVGTLRAQMLPYAVAFTLLGSLLAYVLVRIVTAPIKKLVEDVDAVAAGDLQHRTQVHTDDELGLLARTMDSMVRRIDHAVLDHDEEVAADLHRKLVAEAIPIIPHFDVDVLHLLTKEVGGAYYDFLQLPDGHVGFVVAEASARGIPAAMNVVMAGALLRARARETTDPAQILCSVNRTLYESLHAEMSVSCVVAVLDRDRSQLTVAGAGSLEILVHRAATGELERIVPSGDALGIGIGESYDAAFEVVRIDLAPDDRVVIGNQGAARLTNERGEALGLDRFRDFVSRVSAMKPEYFKGTLRQYLYGFAAKQRTQDDVVVLTVRATSPAAAATSNQPS